MLKCRSLVGVAAALVATPLMGLPAWGAPACVTDTVAAYEALGAVGCSVGPMTFSSINVSDPIITNGSLIFGNFEPFTDSTGTEFGLTLHFLATAQPGGSVDFLWQYNVAGDPFIGDAYLQLAGSPGIGGLIGVTETLSNGVKLEVRDPPGPQVATATFAPVGSLSVLKDQFTYGGTAVAPFGISTVSALTNAFSVPGPIVGAGLPGLMAACGGLLALARRRRKLVV